MSTPRAYNLRRKVHLLLEKMFDKQDPIQRSQMYKYVKMMTGYSHISDLNQYQLETLLTKLQELFSQSTP